MGLKYNKEYVPKDRRIQTRGPRDLQRRQQMAQSPEVNQELVRQLQDTIDSLRKQLEAQPIGTYTADQVNTEVIKAVKAETADLKGKYEERIKDMEFKILNQSNEIKILKAQLEASKSKEAKNSVVGVSEEMMRIMMDELSDKVKTLALASGKSIEEVDPDRPQMETIFIDPIERENGVESHINIEEDSSMTKKEEMANQVNKLKGLLGKGIPKIKV